MRLPFAAGAVVAIVGLYVALTLSLDFGGADLGRSLATEAGATGYEECYGEHGGVWGCRLIAGRASAEYDGRPYPRQVLAGAARA